MQKKMTSCVRIAVAVVWMSLLCWPERCRADAATGGSSTNYKIYDNHRLLLVLGVGKSGKPDPVTRFVLEDITPCIAQDKVEPTYACTRDELNGSVSALAALCDSSLPPRPGQSCTVEQKDGSVNVFFNFLDNELQGSRQYRLTYWQKGPKSEDGKDGKESATVVMVDTTPVVAVIVQPKAEGQYQLTLSSSLAYTHGSNIALGTPRDCPVMGSEEAANAAKWKPVTFTAPLGDGSAMGPGPTSVNGLIGVPTDYTEGELPGTGYSAQIGTAFVCIDARKLVADFTPSPAGAAAALAQIGVHSPLQPPANSGHYKSRDDLSPSNFVTYARSAAPSWTFASGAKFSPAATAPTGKTDASFYASVNMVAATGARFAWGLDGKLAELQRGIGKSNWTITWLSATANTGNNTSSIKSQTYTDSIDWTLPISHEWDRIGGHTTTLVFVVNPDYSTDIEFDRKNLLAEGHFVWIPRSLYQTLEKRNAGLNNVVSGALWKYPNLNSKVHVAGELDFRGGMEAGGALIDTTQKASSGTAKITVPAYNIARVVPQIHGLFQWLPLKSTGLGLLTIDETLTGRYLMATENTVEQYNIPATNTASATVGLLPRPITGWKGYNSLITTWYPPHISNFGLAATFNDGFNAPKFSRVNCVTIGVTIMY